MLPRSWELKADQGRSPSSLRRGTDRMSSPRTLPRLPLNRGQYNEIVTERLIHKSNRAGTLTRLLGADDAPGESLNIEVLACRKQLSIL